MARFRFSLGPLLRLRETLEEREREVLEAIARQIQSNEELLLQNGNERQQLRENALRRLSTGVGAGEMRLDELSYAALTRREHTILRQVEALRVAWQEQYEKFIQARKDSEVLRSLRSQQRAAFALAQRRAEQQESDDLYNLRAVRSKL